MKLLINTSTLSATGVTQVATSFISECCEFTENQYHVFLSKAVEQNLNLSLFPSNFHFYSFSEKKYSGFRKFYMYRKLKTLEEKIAPDCTFSVFGPSYWAPKSPHLMGYAYPHYIYPESPLFNLLGIREKMVVWLKKRLHKFYLIRDGNYYVCETEDISRRLFSFLPVSDEQVFTVNNTCNHYFTRFKNEHENSTDLIAKSTDEFRFLSLCSPYLHKNLQILNKVVPLLLQKDLFKKVKFVVTIDDESYNRIFDQSIRGYIINLGPQLIESCPVLYYNSDALFLPTLLECFSANYPEAMCMEKAILTSNLSFAFSVCENAALYFDPLDPSDIVERTVMIVNNNDLYDKLVENGRKQFLKFNSSQERAFKYLNICSKIASSSSNISSNNKSHERY